jgi:hypothetical protein
LRQGAPHGNVHGKDWPTHRSRRWHARELSRNLLATLGAFQALGVPFRQIDPQRPIEAERQEDCAHHVAVERAIDRAANVIRVAVGR